MPPADEKPPATPHKRLLVQPLWTRPKRGSPEPVKGQSQEPGLNCPKTLCRLRVPSAKALNSSSDRRPSWFPSHSWTIVSNLSRLVHHQKQGPHGQMRQCCTAVARRSRKSEKIESQS